MSYVKRPSENEARFQDCKVQVSWKKQGSKWTVQTIILQVLEESNGQMYHV
jgi:hypothetical protein